MLGRGLRIPPGLGQPAVRINNHEKWSQEIKELYEEVLELDNRITYGYSKANAQFSFPLYNLYYSQEEEIVSSSGQASSEEPKIEKLTPQSKVKKTHSEYSESGMISYTMEIMGNQPIDTAARQIKLFLKEKNANISKKWPVFKIKRFLKGNLDKPLSFQTNLYTEIGRQMFV